MDRECICKIRDIYRNIAAFEAQLQRQLHLNMKDGKELLEHFTCDSLQLPEQLQSLTI